MPKPIKLVAPPSDTDEDDSILQGVLDLPESLYKQVSKTGKSASEKIKLGDYAGALHDVIAPVADPITGVISSGINAIQGKKPMDVGSPDDVNKQIIGATGLPADAVSDAWKKGNYRRLAGQGIGAVTALALSHKLGGGEEADTLPDVAAPKGDISLPKDVPSPVVNTPSDIPASRALVARPKPTFIAGERGVVPNKPQPLDVGPISPRMGAKDQGTILPQELGQVNMVPPEIAATYSGQGTPRPVDVQVPNNRTLPPPSNPIADFKSSDTNIQYNDASKMSPDSLSKLNDFMNKPSPEPVPDFEQLKKDAIGEVATVPRYYTGEGRALPGEPQLPSAPVRTRNQVFDKPPIDEAPKIDLPSKNVEPIKPTLEEVNPPGVAKVPEVPNPGNAKVSQDINAFRAEYGSADKTLASRPESAPIAERIIKANDDKMQWVATVERQLADLTKGLSYKDRVTVGQLLDNFENPSEARVDPKLGQIALAIRQKLTDIHSQIPGGIKEGKDVGFIENYLTHIESQAPSDLVDGMKQIWEYHLGQPFKKLFGSEPLTGEGEGIGDMYGTGKGNPNSQFSEPRTGRLSNIELDVNKVLPAYVESIAKLIHDKPAVDSAKKVLATIPDSNLKELAGWYIKNYSRYDAQPGLSEGWNDWTSKLARTTSRSMLGFSTGLQTLHLARIVANLWPEIPTKYLLSGMGELATKNVGSWQEMAKLGMLSNELRPWAFKTTSQKVDSVIHLFSTADSLDRAIGYYGFKKMYLDQGLSPEQAVSNAISSSKRASLMVDPARSTLGFTPDAKFSGGALGKLTTQFKQVPAKIVEQYIQIGSKAIQDPKAAGRMLAGVGTALALYEAGAHTFHVSPKQFALQTGGASLSELVKILSPNGQALYKSAKLLGEGDVEGALQLTSDYLSSDKFYKSAEEAALLAIPGGLSIKRQMDNGLSMFEKE